MTAARAVLVEMLDAVEADPELAERVRKVLGGAVDQILTIEQGAALYEWLSPWTIRRWIKSGRLAASEIDGRGTYGFRRSALEKAIEAEPAKVAKKGTGELPQLNETDALDELVQSGQLREAQH